MFKRRWLSLLAGSALAPHVALLATHIGATCLAQASGTRPTHSIGE
nr:hypothetical protein [Pseudomonas sp.]